MSNRINDAREPPDEGVRGGLAQLIELKCCFSPMLAEGCSPLLWVKVKSFGTRFTE